MSLAYLPVMRGKSNCLVKLFIYLVYLSVYLFLCHSVSPLCYVPVNFLASKFQR